MEPVSIIQQLDFRDQLSTLFGGTTEPLGDISDVENEVRHSVNVPSRNLLAVAKKVAL